MCGCDWIGLDDWTNWMDRTIMDGDGRAEVGCSAVGWSGVRVRSILGGWASEDGVGGGGEGELLPAVVVVTVIVARR